MRHSSSVIPVNRMNVEPNEAILKGDIVALSIRRTNSIMNHLCFYACMYINTCIYIYILAIVIHIFYIAIGALIALVGEIRYMVMDG